MIKAIVNNLENFLKFVIKFVLRLVNKNMRVRKKGKGNYTQYQK